MTSKVLEVGVNPEFQVSMFEHHYFHNLEPITYDF